MDHIIIDIYLFMFLGFLGGYNFILVMDMPCAGADNAPAFLPRIKRCVHIWKK